MEVDGKIDWILMAMKVGHVIVTAISVVLHTVKYCGTHDVSP